MRGTLFLVVGPSGAGKDSLIAAARTALGTNPHYFFPTRVVTRPGRDASEDHVFEEIEAFERREREGAFALTWRAHDLAYGVPSLIEEQLADGVHVVVNVSRSVVAAARKRLAPVRVLEVTAPHDVLAARLKARGRESDDKIAERISRSVAVASDTVIVNDGPLEPAVAAFLRALSEVETSGQAP